MIPRTLEEAKAKLYELTKPFYDQLNRSKPNLDFRPYVDFKVDIQPPNLVAQIFLQRSPAFGLFKKPMFGVKVEIHVDNSGPDIRYLRAEITETQYAGKYTEGALTLKRAQRLASQGALDSGILYGLSSLGDLRENIKDGFGIPLANIKIKQNAW